LERWQNNVLYENLKIEEDSPLEKVKIFSRGITDTSEELDADINAWLHQNPDITITQRLVTSAAGRNMLETDYVNITVVIFFVPTA
jgi:hypothetical protein